MLVWKNAGAKIALVRDLAWGAHRTGADLLQSEPTLAQEVQGRFTALPKQLGVPKPTSRRNIKTPHLRATACQGTQTIVVRIINIRGAGQRLCNPHPLLTQEHTGKSCG